MQETINKAVCDAKEWKSAQLILPTVNRSHPQSHRPPDPEILCRSDAAWKSDLQAAGLAWSFSDTYGERINSHSETCAFVISSLVAEGLAMRSAMDHAIALQLDTVIFESDSMQLVATIVGKASFSDLHGIISDIHLLSSSFVSVSFRFSHRSSLVFEDGLAKQALNCFVLNPV